MYHPRAPEIQVEGRAMKRDATAQRVLAHIRRITSLKHIDVDCSFENYSIDSITSMELLMDLEREFNVSIPDEKIEELTTARAVIELVQALLALHVDVTLEGV